MYTLVSTTVGTTTARSLNLGDVRSKILVAAQASFGFAKERLELASKQPPYKPSLGLIVFMVEGVVVVEDDGPSARLYSPLLKRSREIRKDLAIDPQRIVGASARQQHGQAAQIR